MIEQNKVKHLGFGPYTYTYSLVFIIIIIRKNNFATKRLSLHKWRGLNSVDVWCTH